MRRRIVRERMSQYQWSHTRLGKIRELVWQLGIAPAKIAPPVSAAIEP